MSLDVHPHPFDRIHFENSLSLVIAENRGGGGAIITDSTKYLPLIPPLHLVSEVRYDLRKQVGLFAHMFFKVGMQVYWSQNRFYSASGTETRTPGYTLLDAGIGSDVVDKEGRTILTFTLLGSNLADVGYQSNMSRLKYFEDYPENGSGRSGIYNMGRNFSLKVVVPFDGEEEQFSKLTGAWESVPHLQSSSSDSGIAPSSHRYLRVATCFSLCSITCGQVLSDRANV